MNKNKISAEIYVQVKVAALKNIVFGIPLPLEVIQKIPSLKIY